MNLNLKSIYDSVSCGDISVLGVQVCADISTYSEYLISKQPWDQHEQVDADLILRISNIVYNNTTLEVLPLDDGLYDQLLQLYKSYDANYQIGAMPVSFNEVPQNEFVEETKLMFNSISNEDMDSALYVRDILSQHTQKDPRLVTMFSEVREPITKRLVNTPHQYPELVGTLDKCKFVLNSDAVSKGVFDKPSVQVFERDFIHKCLSSGIISSNEVFEMVGELKYDGVSVEADICGDTIISARSRGDTGEDIATDLTPILGGYKFPNAKNVPKDRTFGMKFEAVITKYDLERMSVLRNKSYRNCRNAIIGLFGAGDAYRFRDFITLIPLATSLHMDRLDELEFLNKYYNSGQYNRHVVFRGDYQSILFQVNQFTKSAEISRPVLPYLIDGVVISFIDPEKIDALGRKNSVNKYSMAIKFNPRKVRTVFLGYTFSIGKSGDVIPMVHFKQCEFMGNIQSKQTLHSLNRFNELQLRYNDQIDIEYVNDVITYVTKPDTEYNRTNQSPFAEFISVCPYCGSEIQVSPSGKSAKCINPECPERNVQRMVDMLKILNFKDFSEATVRTLGIKSFTDLINLTLDRCMVLGPINAQNLIARVNVLKTEQISDFKIMAALNFPSIGAEKWKLILSTYNIGEIMTMPITELSERLAAINGIGDSVISTIMLFKELYRDDIMTILSMPNIISSKGLVRGDRVVLSGFRDAEFIEILKSHGYDADENYSLTKNTKYLIIKDKNSTSGKVEKAKAYGVTIMTIGEFVDMLGIKL